MKSIVDQLNDFPALRLLVLVLTFVAGAVSVTWTIGGKLGEIKTSLALIEERQSTQTGQLSRLDRAVTLNTEFRLRTEGGRGYHD